MCLMAFAWQLHPEYPLILIANRDEFYDRPTRIADWWQEHPDIVGGRDIQAGGSWLALHKDGRFAAVTNHRDGRQQRSGERSRGALIRNYLTGTDSAAAFCDRQMPDLQHYGGFNLLLGDNEGLWYLSNRGGGCYRVEPGLHGLSNAFLNTPWPKTDALKQRLHQALNLPLTSDMPGEQHSQPGPQALLTLLQHREQAADAQLPDTGIRYEWEKMLSSCFIQSADTGYGTRASTLLLLHSQGQHQLVEKSFSLQGYDGQVSFEL
ncbi:MAG: NRDE family protein [Marinobacterium sp.]|nr:NRDE family protein [Marinobacterium sp.]